MGAGSNSAADAVLNMAVIEHGPRWTENGGDVHADGAHHRARRGFVAASQQHRTVTRQASQQLFHLHGQKVSIQHGGWFHHDLAQAHGGELNRVAACHQDALFDTFCTLAQVGVTRRKIAPSVDDGDDGPLHHVLATYTLLLHALTMRKATHAIVGKPATGAKVGK